MESINFKHISKETGFSIEDLQKGYAPSLAVHGVEVIQRLDCLEEFGASKFTNDTEAGKQALKDGYKLFTSGSEALEGWYILDTPENRKLLQEIGS